jgi:hypothetical protein
MCSPKSHFLEEKLELFRRHLVEQPPVRIAMRLGIDGRPLQQHIRTFHGLRRVTRGVGSRGRRSMLVETVPAS